MPYITHGFLRADSRNSMGFILLYGKKNVSRYGFRHSVLEATRRPVCHVILQRCAGRDMLDDAAADRLLAAARKGRLREKALALLTARPMSRRELIDRLTACPRDREKPPLADEAQAAETADWLERLGLLNDAEYARTVVRHYSAKGYGPYKVRDELYRRGVARELWEDALAETADPCVAIDAFLRQKLKGAPTDRREL